ncbi:hypothetical protein GCM10011609_84550 [Lentzea pudingi]|uniref:Amidohydrolase family protein n=1 Tax=Lentzea pudingi TaxID=1789439 RepID=A0ABQ2IRQ5_9PSEU|nr:hypothetical protein [Lentzea pudingi]GGN28423.1 hypothetical protein GCM10011609_84550 [Lentzea pudingi]
MLITDGVITEAAEQIDAPDAEVIDATGRIVLPDFVDTHRHIWQTQFCGLGVDWTFDDYMTMIASAARVERCRAIWPQSGQLAYSANPLGPT